MKQSALNLIKIKDTMLDRRIKLPHDYDTLIMRMYKQGKTCSEIAKEFNTTYAVIYGRVHPEIAEAKRESKRKWYYAKTPGERLIDARRYRKSTNRYKEQLFETKLENILWNN